MATGFEKAIEIAKGKNDNVNACREYNDAYVFYDKKHRWSWRL